MSFTTPLIIGSSSSDGARSTFEKHGETGILLLTGNLSVPRSHHSVTLLQNLSLFVAGGRNNGTTRQNMEPKAHGLRSRVLRDSPAGPGPAPLTDGKVFLPAGELGA